jgi:hypothetical protein
MGWVVAAEVGGAAQEMALGVCLGSKARGGSGSEMVLGASHVVRISLPWREGSIKDGRANANGEATGDPSRATTQS